MPDTKEHLWQEEARRLGGEAFVDVLIEMYNGQREIIKKLSDMEGRHANAEKAIALINRAFPAGDLEGHRRYHETMIETLAEKRRLRIAIQEKTISGLVWSAIVFICLSVWAYLKSKLGN